jgi:hypothetical protein
MAGRHQGPTGKGAIRRLLPQRDSAAFGRGAWRTTRIPAVFLVVSTGEGACPIERQVTVARMPLGAVVWVLSALRFYEITAQPPLRGLAPYPGQGSPRAWTIHCCESCASPGGSRSGQDVAHSSPGRGRCSAARRAPVGPCPRAGGGGCRRSRGTVRQPGRHQTPTPTGPARFGRRDLRPATRGRAWRVPRGDTWKQVSGSCCLERLPGILRDAPA